MILFRCPHCQQQLRVKEQARGRIVRCGSCRREVQTPQGATDDDKAEPSTAAAPSFVANDAPVGSLPSTATYNEPVQATPQKPFIAGFKILEELGRGGMGVVYKARDEKLDRLVALKVMRECAADTGMRERFVREAKAMAALHHDHIAGIYQIGEYADVPYLAMPLLQGESLERCLQREQKLSVAEVLRIGREIAQGLAEAHKHGLIHRDIKPANIFLEQPTASKTDRPTGGRIKILDFGLARMADGNTEITQEGALVGTPAYLSPEQAAGKKADARSDLFSLGCVLYRMCTGVRPFSGETTLALLAAVGTEHPKSPHEIDGRIPQPVSEYVMRLLMKDPSQRPESAQDVVNTLGAMLNETTTATKASGIKGGSTTMGTWRRWLAIAAGVAIVLVALLLLYVAWQPGDGNLPPQARANGLDGLDPSLIPARERFAWQPKELVAVLGTHQGRHWGAVDRIVYLNDGKTIASLFKTVRLWDSATMDQLAEWKTAENDSHILAAAPRAGLLACRSSDLKSLQLWNVSKPNKPRKVNRIHREHEISSAAMNPGGNQLVLATWDRKEAMLSGWDLSKPDNPRLSWNGSISSSWVSALDYSPDGKALAVGCDDKTIRVQDLSVPMRPRERCLVILGRPLESLSLGRERLATVSYADSGLVVQFCDVTKNPPQKLNKHTMHGTAAAFAPDGETLAVATDYGEIGLWRVKTKPEWLMNFKTGPGIVSNECLSIAFSPDGKFLATAHRNGTVRQWRLNIDGKKADELPPFGTGPAGPVTSLAFAANDLELYAGCDDGTMRVWDLAKPRPREKAVWQAHSGPVAYLADLADAKVLISAAGRDRAKIWDLTKRITDGEPVYRFGGEVHSIAVSPTKKKGEFVLGFSDGTIRFFDLSDGLQPKEKHRLQAYGKKDAKAPVTQLAYSPNGQTLVSATANGDTIVRVWDLAQSPPKEKLAVNIADFGRPPPFAVSPDSRTLVVATKPYVVGKFRDLISGQLSNRGNFNLDEEQVAANHILFGSDGETLYIAGGNELVEYRNGIQRRWELPGPVMAMALAHDDRHLAFANSNGTVYVLRLRKS